MYHRPLALVLLAMTSLPAHAILSVWSSSYTYSQNFDTLTQTTGANSSWTNDSSPLPGWSLYNSGMAGITTYIADNGGNPTGGFKSFGANGSSDRALGGLGSGGAYFGSPATGAVAGWLAVAFTNDSGSPLSGFTIGFDGEQWRNGGNTTAQTMVLEYGIGATFVGVSSWTAPHGNFDWTSPIATATAAAIDGNIAGLAPGRGGSIALDWAAGSTLWVRWVENNDAGNDHALAIDNLSFSVSGASNNVPVPGSMALVVVGLGGLGLVRRRVGGSPGFPRG